ncbi:hypothetical protein SAMN05421740_10626 [Parapedobacter koreensis]|uniref:Uncharacterized protein n=1 Tax=Parapedobacter koreensis TaxID=332977 RepID=A0A1H7QQE7_9SPHI|nr:hypothetical protein SAMN05421740_10626 [Parapedobacter koreensis]
MLFICTSTKTSHLYQACECYVYININMQQNISNYRRIIT